MPIRTLALVGLLFGSGACALVYQIVWLREFRLIFGAATPATAAVIAVFLGGLGAGAWWWGPRVDAHARPGRLYARLELLIAVSAALTPLLIWIARKAYIGLGGYSPLRLLLTVLVLGVPTFLMGGTLPAACRAIMESSDVRRRAVARLYGANALGAVTGAMVANFFLLELLGARGTLWLACVVNAIIAAAAYRLPARAPDTAPESTPIADPDSPPGMRGFVLIAAGVVGFAFLTMELVWFRMLAPLLGGSTYTFGLVLALALLGVGAGAWLYSLRSADRAVPLIEFAIVCGLEALCIAVPYALGDRLALLAVTLRPAAGGFAALVGAWTVVAGIVVLPASLVAGYQFPLLLGLLGRARRQVGRDVGLAYASNTVGTIAGSLAAGFLLMPVLTAVGVWQAVVALLVALAIGTAALSWRRSPRLAVAAATVPCVAAVLSLTALGPTAVWRHTPIGAGRVDPGDDAISRRDWAHDKRRRVRWSQDGLESSVALVDGSPCVAVLLNGKSDGAAWGDAPTQIMGGLIGTLLHANPQAVFVVGLGTGTSSGWLATVPGVTRVDTVELEAAVVAAASVFAPVNRDALNNPKVQLVVGDAREVIMTRDDRYDVILSVPSNPYRAGVSSLFTQEFYESVRSRMNSDGVFLQWVQGYEVDAQTVGTVYATLLSVFGHVASWHVGANDLLLMATPNPPQFDESRLRARLASEPYREALSVAWRTEGLDGLMTHYIGGTKLAKTMATTAGARVNTDDRSRIEYAFARTVGRTGQFDIYDVERLAHTLDDARPPTLRSSVNWEQVQGDRVTFRLFRGTQSVERMLGPLPAERQQRIRAQRDFLSGGTTRPWWKDGDPPPAGPLELALTALAAATQADPLALEYAEALRVYQPTEADIALAMLHHGNGDKARAAAQLESAFVRYRKDAWASPHLVDRAIELAVELSRGDPDLAATFYDLLGPPFVMDCVREGRTQARLNLALELESARACTEALAPLEPFVPWNRELLSVRARCYELTKHPFAQRAAEELAEIARTHPR